MNKYNILAQLGDGSFGSVLKAQSRDNGEFVRSSNLVCHQKDEEEILLVERMSSATRS